MKTITVELFGRLKDQLGFVQRRYQTESATVADLWQEIVSQSAVNGKLEQHSIRPAVNDEFARWDQPVSEGDRIAFLPPSAGG